MSGCWSAARSSKHFIDSWNKSEPVSAAVLATAVAAAPTAAVSVAIDRKCSIILVQVGQ